MSARQDQIREWHRREFPTETVEQVALVVAEEAGEVARCIVKGAQGIRGGTEHWDAELPKEAADVVIALYALAALKGWDLDEAIEDRWWTVGARRFATAGLGEGTR
jgi:NTP pyrophosphatase (non-canonical NTP hydrolase)